MTATMPVAVTRAELDREHTEIIRETLPLVGARIDEIAMQFYRRMFDEQPQLLRNLFNRGNQARGAQQRALAAAIATFATHLVDPELPHPRELLSRIGHRHASLGITAEQYDIVHKHLFAGIAAVLGPDVVTEEVAAAWDRVYWIMADTLIDLERQLYRNAGVDDGDVYRRAVVVSRTDDPSGTVVLSVRSTGDPFPEFFPAQYVSVGVTLTDGARQLRQYNLVNAPQREDLAIAVKPVTATADEPAGEVSTWIRDNVYVGDLVDVTVPFGDLPPPQRAEPLVLISSGIGITPMIGILEYLTASAPDTSVRVWHADRTADEHPLRGRQHELIARLPNATLDLWYEHPPADSPADVHPGLLDLDTADLPRDARIYLSGSDGFVQSVRAQLMDRGVPADRLHCELLSPSDWLV